MTRDKNRIMGFYLILVHMTINVGSSDVYIGRRIECYRCSGGAECGVLFSPSVNNKTKYLTAHGNELFYSCSIKVNFDGLTTRDLVPSNECRSSSYEFCCKDDLCNMLPSPPLPAFTNLTCMVGHCWPNGSCHDSRHTAFRSSPVQACSLSTQEEYNDMYKSYQKKCFPGATIIPAADVQAYMTIRSRCCYSSDCNEQALAKRMTIKCYVCDSRVTGLLGCSILNTSSLHVQQFGSSNPLESCATIVGLAQQDSDAKSTYPFFTIRTYIADCYDQPLGVVSYGGITFYGRINCCRFNMCNTESLDNYMSFTIPTTTTTTTTTTTIITTTPLSFLTTTTTATTIVTTVIQDTTTTTTTTTTKRDSYISKRSIIIAGVITICTLTICILWANRQLHGKQSHRIIRRYLFNKSTEQIPVPSPLEPSALPFLQDH